MNSKLNARLDLFEKNNAILKKKYWAKNTGLQILGGFIYTCSEREADLELLDECRGILAKNFGVFSSARDMLQLPLMASMAVSGNPQAYAEKLASTYEYVKKGTVFPGDFEMLASIVLMDTPGYAMQETAEKMKRIYKKMRKNHPMLTDSSDKSSAAILTLSERDEDALIEEMENCFEILKTKLKGRRDAVQTMSAFLALQEGSVEEKCGKTAELCELLKEKKLNLKPSMMLPIVAGLSVVDLPSEAIVEAVAEAAEALKGKTGFGFFGLGKEGRIAYAIANCLACADEMGDAASAILKTGVVNIIIQEIITLMICMSAASASASANNS